MPITLFYRFVITFADAASRGIGDLEGIDRFYHVVESQPSHWAVSENAQLVAIDDAQLAHLLAALAPLPDPAIEPIAFGSDGTWITIVIQRADGQRSYRWWSRPPDNWHELAALIEFVQQLADAPRLQEAERQRQITRQFFAHLAARDLPRMLALYHPNAHYSNPFFELRGVQIGAMWRMGWSYLPDLRVVCTDSDIRGSSVYWAASYMYPPTGRYVEQHLTANLTFADDLIIQHVDRFNIHEWAHNVYGVIGRMLGGTGMFERWIAARARARLAPFLGQQPERL